jgi:nitrate reductase beta subunit
MTPTALKRASTEHETDLYERQCEVFLNPNDPAVIEEALKQAFRTTSLTPRSVAGL